MTEQSTELAKIDEMRPKILIAGALLGLAVGVAGAYLLVQRYENSDEEPDFSLGDGVRIGVMAFGLLRSISQL